MALCSGPDTQRQERKIRMIFQLRTIQLKGLNINFNFLRFVTCILRTLRFTRHALQFNVYWQLRSAKRVLLVLKLKKGHTLRAHVSLKTSMTHFDSL